MKVGPCGAALCATIAAPNPLTIRRPAGPGQQNNPDPAQRGRRLVGVPVLYGLVPDGPGRWSGRLYNVDNGNSYAGRLLELGPTTIRVEGCAIGICGGQNMKRIKSPAIRTGSTTSPLRRGTVHQAPAASRKLGLALLRPFQQLRQLCNAGCNAPRLILRHRIRPRRAYPVRFRSKTYATAKLLTSRTM